jgi:hypothetical protein
LAALVLGSLVLPVAHHAQHLAHAAHTDALHADCDYPAVDPASGSWHQDHGDALHADLACVLTQSAATGALLAPPQSSAVMPASSEVSEVTRQGGEEVSGSQRGRAPPAPGVTPG